MSKEVPGRESSFVKHSKEVVILCEDSKEVFVSSSLVVSREVVFLNSYKLFFSVTNICNCFVIVKKFILLEISDWT